MGTSTNTELTNKKYSVLKSGFKNWDKHMTTSILRMYAVDAWLVYSDYKTYFLQTDI